MAGLVANWKKCFSTFQQNKNLQQYTKHLTTAKEITSQLMKSL